MAEDKSKTEEMPFLGHLETLRWVLIRSFLAISIVSVLVFVNKRFIFDGIILAPQSRDFVTYRILCHLSEKLFFNDSFCIKDISFTLTNIDMTGQFILHFVVSLILGLIVVSPYIFWELWRFIKPALYSKEKHYTKGIVLSFSLLFLTGILFGYYVLTPISINFLGNYQVSELVSNQITLSSYINTLTMLCFACGIVFELPVMVYILSKIGFVTPQFLRTYRKHSIVILLVISGLITPPDVASQIFICLPLLLLYEISILVSKLAAKNK